MEKDRSVIVFSNLRQRTDVVGAFEEVKAKNAPFTAAKPFSASNAAGTLAEVKSYEDVRKMASESARGLAYLKSKSA